MNAMCRKCTFFFYLCEVNMVLQEGIRHAGHVQIRVNGTAHLGKGYR